MHPDYTHFPVLTGSSPALMTTSKQKKKKREKKYQVQYMLPIFFQEHGQTPRGQSL